MSSSGRPQLQQIRLTVGMYPGISRKELLKAKGIGTLAIANAISLGIIKENGKPETYVLTKAAAEPEYQVPAIKRNGKAGTKAVDEATRSKLRREAELTLLALTPEPTPAPATAGGWEDFKDEAAKLVERMTKFADEQVASFRGPVVVRDLMRTEYDERLKGLVEALGRVFA